MGVQRSKVCWGTSKDADGDREMYCGEGRRNLCRFLQNIRNILRFCFFDEIDDYLFPGSTVPPIWSTVEFPAWCLSS